MKPKILIPAVILLMGVTAFVTFSFINPGDTETTGSSYTEWKKHSASKQLHSGMRKLWEDHITWTRNVIFCIVDDLPGKDDAVKRLLKNQDDIGNAIKPYYGADASKKLSGLLRTHITQAADLLTALKKDDNMAVEEINKKWKANADEIAMFLSDANPNWTPNDLKKMMQDHLSLTIEEAKARKNKDYPGDVVAYDKVHDEILEMSDMLSEGIMKHFPDKFKMEKSTAAK